MATLKATRRRPSDSKVLMSPACRAHDFAPVSTRALRALMPSSGRATHSQAPMMRLGQVLLTVPLLGFRQILDHGPEEPGGFTAGTGPMIKGQRQRQRPVDFYAAQNRHHFVAQHARSHNGDTGRDDDGRCIAAGKDPEVGQHDGVVLEIFRRDAAVLDVFLQTVDFSANLFAGAAVYAAHPGNEQAIRRVDSHAHIHALVQHAHVLFIVVPGVEAGLFAGAGRQGAKQAIGNVLAAAPGVNIGIIHQRGGHHALLGLAHDAGHGAARAAQRLPFAAGRFGLRCGGGLAAGAASADGAAVAGSGCGAVSAGVEAGAGVSAFCSGGPSSAARRTSAAVTTLSAPLGSTWLRSTFILRARARTAGVTLTPPTVLVRSRRIPPPACIVPTTVPESSRSSLSGSGAAASAAISSLPAACSVGAGCSSAGWGASSAACFSWPSSSNSTSGAPVSITSPAWP